MRQPRRRRPEHGQRAAAPPRLGPEPAGRARDRRPTARRTARSPPASSCSRWPGSATSGSRRRPGSSRLRDGDDPLDGTWIHPESYPLARQVLTELGFTPADLRDRAKVDELRAKLNATNLTEIAAKLERRRADGATTSSTPLARPGRDPREDLPPPIFKKGILKLEDLTPGMELKGTVLNVVPIRRVRGHRAEGQRPGPHQPDGEPLHQEPLRRGRRRRRGDGLGDGGEAGREEDFAVDDPAGPGAAQSEPGGRGAGPGNEGQGRGDRGDRGPRGGARRRSSPASSARRSRRDPHRARATAPRSSPAATGRRSSPARGRGKAVTGSAGAGRAVRRGRARRARVGSAGRRNAAGTAPAGPAAAPAEAVQAQAGPAGDGGPGEGEEAGVRLRVAGRGVQEAERGTGSAPAPAPAGSEGRGAEAGRAEARRRGVDRSDQRARRSQGLKTPGYYTVTPSGSKNHLFGPRRVTV